MYKVYEMEVRNAAHFLCEFTSKEKAVEYVRRQKTNCVVSKNGNIVYQNY